MRTHRQSGSSEYWLTDDPENGGVVEMFNFPTFLRYKIYHLLRSIFLEVNKHLAFVNVCCQYFCRGLSIIQSQCSRTVHLSEILSQMESHYFCPSGLKILSRNWLIR